MPKLFPSCSPGAPSWGAVRVEQRWDGRPEMRPFALIGSGRKRSGRCGARGQADAKPALGRPWPAVRRHYDRLPAVLRNDGLHAAVTKERRPPLRIGGLNTGPVAARKHGPKGFQDAACGAPGGAFLRSQGGRRRLRTVSRAASPAAQERDRKRSAFPGAPLPWFGERDEEGDEGLPGADQRIRAMTHAMAGWCIHQHRSFPRKRESSADSQLGPRFRGDERRIDRVRGSLPRRNSQTRSLARARQRL